MCQILAVNDVQLQFNWHLDRLPGGSGCNPIKMLNDFKHERNLYTHIPFIYVEKPLHLLLIYLYTDIYPAMWNIAQVHPVHKHQIWLMSTQSIDFQS